MKLAPHTRRTIRTTLAIVAGWIIASLATTLATLPEDESLPLAATLLFGLAAGGISAWFERILMPRYVRRFSAGMTLLLRVLFYLLIMGTLVLFFTGLLGRIRLGGSLLDIYTSSEFQVFLHDGQFVTIVALLTLASFLLNFIWQVNRMLGPGQLASVLLGRYSRPVREERIFMFLDLTGSTAIAEQLGAARFNDFKNDFFHDITDPVLASRGEVYQYVGDEVVVTWNRKKRIRPGDCVRCFFRIADRVQANRTRYLRRYGVVPAFKAGFHGGMVVAAEIGDLKKAIVYSGDVVNTTARIEAQCRPLGRAVLVSEYLFDASLWPDELEVEDLGPITLRGKAQKVRLFSITRWRREVTPPPPTWQNNAEPAATIGSAPHFADDLQHGAW